MYTCTLSRLWLYFAIHLISHTLQMDFKWICKGESFSDSSENGGWTKPGLSSYSEESQKIHKYKVKFPLTFANDTRNQTRQNAIPQLYIVFYAYIDIQISDKNRDVLSSEIIYWVSLVLSSHFLFQLLGTNGWSCSVSSPQALREKRIAYCFYLPLNLFSATSQGDMIINLEDNDEHKNKLLSFFYFML